MHKDLKPDNALFDVRGYLHICDFSISQTFDEPQRFAGTPKYRGPNVIMGKPHEASIDYFALGIIAHLCLFGRHLYSISE